MSDEVRIAYGNPVSLSIDELHDFQGELKSLSKENYEKLKKEILETGFAFAPHVWFDPEKQKYFIVDAHQRKRTLLQMKRDGYQIPMLPCIPVKAKDYHEAKRRVLQGTSQYGVIESQGLYEFMMESSLDPTMILDNFRLPDIDPNMFMQEYFTEPETEGNGDEDATPEPPKEPKSKLGDLWLLGDHRLICGDSTEPKLVERLMKGEKASVWLSDPPYGISHVETSQEKNQSKGYKPIANDDLQDEAFEEFIFKTISASLPHMKKGFAFYMWHAMKMQGYTAAAAAAAGILFHRQIVWVKKNFVFGRGHYHWRHELCLMGWLQGNEPEFFGERNQSSVWNIERENDKIHPTQKPIDLLAPSILNHTKRSEIIYEPFCGSGSTLIASEKLGRRCFALELEPAYIDVILTRWATYTGKDPVPSM